MGYGKDSAGGDTFSYAENVDIIGMSSSSLIISLDYLFLIVLTLSRCGIGKQSKRNDGLLEQVYCQLVTSLCVYSSQDFCSQAANHFFRLCLLARVLSGILYNLFIIGAHDGKCKSAEKVTEALFCSWKVSFFEATVW
jgi:hypothetical protein